MSESKPLRAIFYLRLSVDRHEESTSIQRQRDDLDELARERGWNVVEVLTDDGVSGGVARQNADRALSMLRDREADVLAVWKFDRWSRQGVSAVAALADVIDERRDALFVALRDGWDSSSKGWRLIASIMSEVARDERENTAARVASSIDHLRRNRRFAGGTVPYGYVSAPNPDGPGRALMVDRSEADEVVDMAARLLEGQSLRRVCRSLNEREVPAPRSAYRRAARQGGDLEGIDKGKWRQNTVRTIVTGNHVLGRVTHRGEVIRGDDGLPLEVWEPILDLPTVQALRARIPTPRRATDADGTDVAVGATPLKERRTAAVRLLSGLVRCAHCGAKMHVITVGRHVVYGCPSARTGVDCPSPRISAPSLERYVSEGFLESFGVQPWHRGELLRPDPAPELRARLAEAEEELRRLSHRILDEGVDVAVMGERIAVLKESRSRLRSQVGEGQVLHVLVPDGTYADRWGRAVLEDGSPDLDQRRELIADFVDSVRVSSGARGGGFDPSRVDVVLSPGE